MTNEQRHLLQLCRPDVVLQGRVQAPDRPHEINPHFYAAEECVSKGWLIHIRDQEFEQSVYRITGAGLAALMTSPPLKQT